MLDLDAIRKRYDVKCKQCDGTGVVGTSFAFGRSGCWVCLGRGITNPMPDDVAAMLAELERLYAAPVAEPVQPTTPGAQEAAIAGELQRMLTKPRGEVCGTPSPSCPGCGSLAVFVQSERGETIHVCGNCWREW